MAEMAEMTDIMLCRTQALGGRSYYCGPSAETISKLARGPQWVGGEIGMLGNLQTWTRDMRYHVHAHFIIPAGGISQDRKRWLPARHHFLFPQKAVASILQSAKT